MKKEKTQTLRPGVRLIRIKVGLLNNNPFGDFIKFKGLYGNLAEPKRKEYIRLLGEDIVKEGLKNPPLVKKEGKKYKVLQGHHRIQAMKDLGWKTIKCKVTTEDL